MYFDWRFYTEAEDRSLDHIHEILSRQIAAWRAILNLKLRLFASGLHVALTAGEHILMAVDYEAWASSERDPAKAAHLARMGALNRALAKTADERKPKKPRRPRANRS